MSSGQRMLDEDHMYIRRNVYKTVTNDQIMNNTLIFSTLNCEAVKRSTEYIRSYLDKYTCDGIALKNMAFRW